MPRWTLIGLPKEVSIARNVAAFAAPILLVFGVATLSACGQDDGYAKAYRMESMAQAIGGPAA
ncbi:MAG: hypothetical protein KAI47_20910, partial [Deltaproteobacteria bacterium]|nr:hypothetical protein [Deltaproteobacteria bacterium]